MGPAETAIILKFLMSKLSEDELAELDKLLDNDPKTSPTAGKADLAERDDMSMDSRSVDRRAWLAMDSRSRIAVRADRAKSRMGLDAAQRTSFESRYPGTAKIGRI